MFEDEDDDVPETDGAAGGFDDPEDLDVEDLEDDPAYEPDDPAMKDLKGG